MCLRQPSFKAISQLGLITNLVSRNISWTNGIALNVKAGILLSIFEQCRSWQFCLISLEGISMLEPFVPTYTSKHGFEHAMQHHKSIRLCSCSASLLQKFLQTSCLTGLSSDQGGEARKREERGSERGMLCSQTPKEAEATQMGNATFPSQPHDAK